MTETSHHGHDAETPPGRLVDLEEKIMFLEHELVMVQSLLGDIFSRIEVIERVVQKQKSEFEDRIAGLEAFPDEEPPPPHWGRARPE